MEIDENKKIGDLTVKEFRSILCQPKGKELVYGLKGLAKILGCCRSKASQIKSSGILDDAISQNGKLIVIDKHLALELFHQHSTTK